MRRVRIGKSLLNNFVVLTIQNHDSEIPKSKVQQDMDGIYIDSRSV
jgi:hypothetical protein